MPRVNAIILAGGQSSRMGENKAFLPLGNTTFIQSLIKTLEPLVERVIISGNYDVYKSLGYPVVEDEHFNCGPLAGIYAGLKWSNTDWNIVVSVDAPFVDGFTFKILKEEIDSLQQAIVVETPTRKMPLIGVYHKSCKEKIEQALEQKSLKVMGVLDELKTKCIMVNESYEHVLTNINTPQEYQDSLTEVSVRFFGQLAELTGKEEIQMVLPTNITVEEVRNKLFLDYKGLEYRTYKIALNNVLANDSDRLTQNAKVDFLPAFAGG